MKSTFALDHVTVEFTYDDWALLMMCLGYSLGAAAPKDQPFFWVAVKFVNALNQGNPKFTPYEVPAEP